MLSLKGMYHSHEKGMIKFVANGYFVFHGIELVLIKKGLFAVWVELSHKFDSVKLAILQTTSQVHFAEPTNCQTVIDLVSEVVADTWLAD